jgi:hypothetical protein
LKPTTLTIVAPKDSTTFYLSLPPFASNFITYLILPIKFLEIASFPKNLIPTNSTPCSVNLASSD